MSIPARVTSASRRVWLPCAPACGCEIRTDRLTRVLYSTDASNHQIEPLGVAFPRDLPELAQIIAAAADLGLPVLPRGAGTSLAGQAVGAAVILDLSRHLRRIGRPGTRGGRDRSRGRRRPLRRQCGCGPGTV